MGKECGWLCFSNIVIATQLHDVYASTYFGNDLTIASSTSLPVTVVLPPHTYSTSLSPTHSRALANNSNLTCMDKGVRAHCNTLLPALGGLRRAVVLKLHLILQSWAVWVRVYHFDALTPPPLPPIRQLTSPTLQNATIYPIWLYIGKTYTDRYTLYIPHHYMMMSIDPLSIHTASFLTDDVSM